MVVVERHVGDEAGHAVAAGAVGVGQGEAAPLLAGDAPPREERRAPHEHRCRARDHVVDPRGGREPDEPGRTAAARHGDARVRQHHPCDALGVGHRDAHGDGPTPVLRDEPHRLADVERVEEVEHIGDAVAVGAGADTSENPIDSRSGAITR